jgi:hypothetical protein
MMFPAASENIPQTLQRLYHCFWIRSVLPVLFPIARRYLIAIMEHPRNPNIEFHATARTANPEGHDGSNVRALISAYDCYLG